MKVAAAVSAAAISTCLAACGPAVSLRPLYTAAERETPVTELRLAGDWISADFDKDAPEFKSDFDWKITAVAMDRPNGHYTVTIHAAKPLTDMNGATSATLAVRLVSIGDKLFFDAVASPEDDESWPIMFGVVPLHLVGRLWVNGNFLRFAVLDDEWAARNVPESLRHSKDEDIPMIFLGSTSELRDLVVRNADDEKAFRYPTYLCRPGTDCAALAAEDMLARHDRSNDIVGFFLTRGQYARAVAAQRDDFDPNNGYGQARLGTLLLFNREFDAARQAFAAAEALAPGDTFAHDGIAWSYFLERRFADAAAATATPKPGMKSASVDAITLGYFSRLRLGSRASAAAWLKEQVASFDGSVENHAQLLRLDGRLHPHANCETQPARTDAERAECLNSALEGLTNEDPDTGRARRFLERALERSPHDSLMALAVRIELEHHR